MGEREIDPRSGERTFHQPDERDRHQADAEDAAQDGLPDLGPEVDDLRAQRPSSARDPNAPERPRI